jgi:hypothetical protein
VRPMASRHGYVRAPLDAAHLHANTTQRHEPSRETLAAFACGHAAHRNGPGADCVPRPLVSEPPGLVGASGKVGQPRFLHSGMRCAPLAAISFGLRRAFRLWLRIADSFGQHLAQLGLRLRWLPRDRCLPTSHGNYVGMREGELNPDLMSFTSPPNRVQASPAGKLVMAQQGGAQVVGNQVVGRGA